ncbi:MAG: Fis family transcriptional regulator [Cyanobacteria bacterium P01_H01_bin.21]
MIDSTHVGSSFDDFLEEEGILAEGSALALKRVLAWQIVQAMENQGFNKASMADAMNTSRSALDRLLDPENIAVTLKTMDRAATVLGKQFRIELVDASTNQMPTIVSSEQSDRVANTSSLSILSHNPAQEQTD